MKVKKWLSCVAVALGLMLPEWLAAEAFSQAGREGQQPPGGKTAEEEIRIYLLEKGGKAVDLKGITAEIVLESKMGKTETLKAEPVLAKDAPKDLPRETPRDMPGGDRPGQEPRGGQEQQTGKHGGQVVPMENYLVEFLVAKKEKEGEKKAPDHPQGQDKDLGKKEVTESYFRAPLPEAIGREFTASVNFDIRGQKMTAKGFKHPWKGIGGVGGSGPGK
ncbi:MAG: hypothetical protein HY716_17215 [Planctomycetes bacterium]|nr:hypothetical protein [Planctomycetota bacterium]